MFFFYLLELLQEVLRLEVVGNGFVVSSDNFVNLFLPGGLRVAANLDGIEKLSKGGLHNRAKMVGHLYMVVAVVVEVEDAVELRVRAHVQVLRRLDALGERLARVLFHLDVVELPEVAEPLD